MDLAERTRHYYATVDAQDVEGVLDWFSDDAVYHRPGYDPMVGRASLAAFYGGERIIEEGRHTIDHLLVDGTSVAVRGSFTGRLKDGTERTIGFADFIDYDVDDRARERRTYFAVTGV